jgi:hypothetical protein
MAAIKANLKTALRANTTLSGVQVSYGDPGGDAQRETVWLGHTEDGSQEPLAMRAGRRRREENYTLHVHVEVIGRPTPEDNEARATDLCTAVEEVLADDPKVGNTPGVIHAVVAGVEMATGETTDGPRTVLTIFVSVKGVLL